MRRMIPVVLAAVAIMLPLVAGELFCAHAEEAPPPAFKALPFGATYEEVKSYLEQTFKNNPVVADSPDSLMLKQFDLGPFKVDVAFAFNHERRFRGFSMISAMKEQYLEEQVIKDHLALKDIFVNKYGSKVTCKESILIYDGVQCSWRHKFFTIATGYKEGKWKYGVFGFVESKKMVEEENDFQKKQSGQSDKKAGSPF